MTKLRKTVAAALSVASTANAAPMIRAAAVETSADVVKVGFHKKHHRRHGWRRHGWGHYGGYYGGGCFWKKHRFWSDYYGGYRYKRVRVCY